MTNSIYTYSILQYRHSQVLGEVLNIGVLVYFHKSKKLHFLYPEKLIRLRFAYPNVSDKIIRGYFKSFEQKVKELSNKPELFTHYQLEDSLKKFIDNELLPSDSSTLQFAETKKGLVYTEDTKIILDQLFNLYFTVFEYNTNIKKRIEEIDLLNQYKKIIREFDKDLLLKSNNKIFFDYEINESENKHLKFEIAWKENGTTKLIKPISFDVKRDETLLNKGYRYYGRFLDLEEYALSKSYEFDILLAKPKDKKLFKSYDYAIKLLEKPKQVKLIEQSDIKAYSLNSAEIISSQSDSETLN